MLRVIVNQAQKQRVAIEVGLMMTNDEDNAEINEAECVEGVEQRIEKEAKLNGAHVSRVRERCHVSSNKSGRMNDDTVKTT